MGLLDQPLNGLFLGMPILCHNVQPQFQKHFPTTPWIPKNKKNITHMTRCEKEKKRQGYNRDIFLNADLHSCVQLFGRFRSLRIDYRKLPLISFCFLSRVNKFLSTS